MQKLVTAPERPLEAAIRECLGLDIRVAITWSSPLEEDSYAEYRDSAWLEGLGLGRLAGELREYWPDNGPQWDALATTSDKKVLLFEAKSHASEMSSHCGAGPISRQKIARALDAAKSFYGARRNADWMARFYQYANRLAHVQFLRERDVDAHLLFVYFLNDTDMRGPSKRAEWVHAIKDCHDWLGLDREKVHPGVHELYIDVARLAG